MFIFLTWQGLEDLVQECCQKKGVCIGLSENHFKVATNYVKTKYISEDEEDEDEEKKEDVGREGKKRKCEVR